MSAFDFMNELAARLVEALGTVQITDGLDKYDLPVYYRPDARISAVGEDTATVTVELVSLREGYLNRKLTVTVNENG